MMVTAHMLPTLTVLCLLKSVKCGGAIFEGETVQLILIGPSQKRPSCSWTKTNSPRYYWHETDGNQSLLSRFARFISVYIFVTKNPGGQPDSIGFRWRFRWRLLLSFHNRKKTSTCKLWNMIFPPAAVFCFHSNLSQKFLKKYRSKSGV